MNDHTLLLHQTRHVYRWLTRATADVDAAAAAQELGGERSAGRTAPTVRWIVEHLLLETESTAEAVAGLARTHTEDPTLGWDALRAVWLERSAACLAALEGTTAADLDAPPAVKVLPAFVDTLTDRRRWWSGHVFHMGYHLGQLGSLRAELGLGWWQE